jgi:hypothetical protein
MPGWAFRVIMLQSYGVIYYKDIVRQIPTLEDKNAKPCHSSAPQHP